MSTTQIQQEQLRGRSVSDRFSILAIACARTALVAIVNPLGEVIINDDGAFAFSAKSILNTGRFALSVFAGPNLFSQAYWGALFCLPFGFSYTALRFSTLTLSLIGLLAFYGLMRELGATAAESLFCVLVLALNPLFVFHSFSYMTDVPFSATALFAMWLLIRALRRKSKRSLIFGLLAAIAALLIRQTGLAIFFALSLCYLIQGRGRKHNLVRAALPAILGFGVQLSFQAWLRMTGRMPAVFGRPATVALLRGGMMGLNLSTLATAGRLVAWSMLTAVLYVGFFALPFVLFVGFGRVRTFWCQHRWIATSSIFLLVALYLVQPSAFGRLPLLGNILYEGGFGPPNPDLRGGLGASSRAMVGIWIVATVLGLVAGAMFLQALISAGVKLVKEHSEDSEILLLIGTGLIYFLPLPFVPAMFDRYYLPLIPLAVAVLFKTYIGSGTKPRRWSAPAVICLLIYGGFAIAGTHDYLNWQRAQWKALRMLTDVRHIAPERIDGGFEFNTNFNRDITPFGIWKIDGDFTVSCIPLPGYTATDAYTFRRWLPPGENRVLVLEKDSILRTQSTAAATFGQSDGFVVAARARASDNRANR